MKAEQQNGASAAELQFELKYCERCGGLWLRPAGGPQVYCLGCAREVDQLPPPSRTAVSAPRMPHGPRWGVDLDDEFLYDYGDDDEEDQAGGLA